MSDETKVPMCCRGKPLTEERCREILLTPDGLGIPQKKIALEILLKAELRKYTDTNQLIEVNSPKLEKATKPEFIPEPIPEGWIVLRFDGGTSSNTPPFGKGYGSYRIDNGTDGKIERLKFDERMSANVAELRTALYGLRMAQDSLHGDYRLWITGDSQIALNQLRRAFANDATKIANNSSTLFVEAVADVREHFRNNLRIKDCRCVWQPRRYSVAVFGH